MEEIRLQRARGRLRAKSASAAPAGAGAYRGYLRKKRLAVIGIAIATMAIACASLGMGTIALSPADILSVIVGTADAQTTAVIVNMRLPHILTALVAGIALSLSGCAFQSVLRNPLASASTLGVAQGAAFGASVAIILIADSGAAAFEGATSSVNPVITAACAFAGAMLSTTVILGLSRLREMTPESIVLAGVALSALFTAGTTLIQYFAEDSQVAAVVFWTFGDLSRVNWSQLAVMSAVTAASGTFFLAHAGSFNAIESGEGLAHGLGVAVGRTRLACMVAASLAAACVIAFCGIINFVGLVAPHITRRLLGADYRYLMPASALVGASLLLLADIACHAVVAPLILPISAITAFIGAPLFIYLLFKGVSR
ncbi:FecCD family ABC transporter permease [Slackia exigua]